MLIPFLENISENVKLTDEEVDATFLLYQYTSGIFVKNYKSSSVTQQDRSRRIKRHRENKKALSLPELEEEFKKDRRTRDLLWNGIELCNMLLNKS